VEGDMFILILVQNYFCFQKGFARSFYMDSSSKKEVIQGISSYIPILDLKLVKKNGKCAV